MNQEPKTRSLCGLGLALAGGQRWVIRAADEEAEECVERLGQVMQLREASQGREALVAVCRPASGHHYPLSNENPLLCCLPPRLNPELGVIQMQQVGRRIALSVLKHGSLLIHGALAEYSGSGFIMAGHGTVGKSTASRRLPSPWRSLCDDKTLVVRDGRGQYWAHPWPTWSRFTDGGPGGSWAVEHAVPLRAIFFLSQSPSDRLEPVGATQATALTIESETDLAHEGSRLRDPNAARALVVDGISAAKALARAVPAYSLKLSLDGRFWEEIERVLPVRPTEAPVERTKDEGSMTVVAPASRDAPRVVYTGTSMDPTFQEPDLLEVRPYGTGAVRPGDVVCFKSPENGKRVVRRVVSVGRRETGDRGPKEGIRTRGDNSRQADPWVLQRENIIGRITAVQRGARRKAIPGGWRGFMARRGARLGRGIRGGITLLSHTLYRLVVGLGPFDRLLPASLRPRLVRFDARCRVFLKLLSDRQMVGEYDVWLERWHIQRPFRLFVDEQTLRQAGALATRREVR